MAVPHRRAIVGALLCALLAMAAAPGVAQAHGPVAPVASSYLAKITSVPARLDAKVVDGDQLMWLRAAGGETVVVLDYRGAPYLRFSTAGVAVNHNSSMFYLNQSPLAATPPVDLGPSTPPDWQPASDGHEYRWHDGRLHALATVALAPGARLVGRWRIPLLVNGRPSSISGQLWYSPDPSVVWFWPIVVLLACVLAAWRVRSASLDTLVARGLGFAALLAIGTAAVAHELHGRPSVTPFQLIELAIILAFVAWGLLRLAFRSDGFFIYLVIGLVAVWQGAELIPTLIDGFVLIALPAFVVRAAAVVALGTGLSLLVLVFRLAELSDASEGEREEYENEDETAWNLAPVVPAVNRVAPRVDSDG